MPHRQQQRDNDNDFFRNRSSFVPLDASLTSDAPGYGYGEEGRCDNDGRIEGEGGGGGPVCWKCHGEQRLVVVNVRSSAVGVQKKKKKKTKEKQRRSAQQQPPSTARTMMIETPPVAIGARSLPPPPPSSPMTGEEPGAVVVADYDTTTTTTKTTTTNKMKKNNNTMVMVVDCHICHGSGRLPVRIVPPRPGKVTRGRRNRRNATAVNAAAAGADDSSPQQQRTPRQPVGYQVPYYGALVETATRERVDIVLRLQREDDDQDNPNTIDANNNEKVRTMIRPSSSSSSSSLSMMIQPSILVLPTWWPSQPNEELCNLVGEFRILQKVKDHRWTTDDLVTAAVAVAQTVGTMTTLSQQPPQPRRRRLRYCDLGTGNGSVLQMVLYKLLSYDEHIKIELAVGVEARQEALSLLRRSLAFNLGDIDDDIDNDMDDDDGDDANDDDGATAMENHVNDPSFPSMHQSPQKRNRRRIPKVRLVHDDFRQFPSSTPPLSTTDPDFAPHSFDLVTGTPPYFAVQYDRGDNDDDEDATTTTTQPTTIIQQGAMPAARQSAPARCEFRGGIDEYCAAAARLLQPQRESRFVCCVNYANHNRALRAMQQYGLRVVSILYVRGKVGRDRLFVVYVARPMMVKDDDDNNDNDDHTTATTTPTTMVEERELSVRDGAGEWTDEYQNDILRYMDIID